jgi:hypothetical protein
MVPTKHLSGSESSKLSDYLDSKRGATPPLSALSEAVAAIGTGANGTVNVITTDGFGGTVGNTATIEVTEPAGTSALTVVISGVNNEIITVQLDVVGGVAGAGPNTATLIAAAIDAEANFSATASGTGADSIVDPEGPFSFSGGSSVASSANFGPETLEGTGTTESSNSKAFTKDRMHVLSVGAEPLRVLFGPTPGTGSDVPGTGGAIIPANIMFSFRTGVGARFVYIEAADGISPYDASVWQRES